MATERLSVIVPVFNEEPTLRFSLDRLLKAKLPLAIEVIVVDHGSTDGGIEAIQHLFDGGQRPLSNACVTRERLLWSRVGSTKHGDFTVCDADLEC